MKIILHSNVKCNGYFNSLNFDANVEVRCVKYYYNNKSFSMLQTCIFTKYFHRYILDTFKKLFKNKVFNIFFIWKDKIIVSKVKYF